MAKRRSKYTDVKGFAALLNVSTEVVDEWIEKSILSRKSYFRVLGITRIKTSDALKELHEYSNLNHPSDMKSEISTNEGSKNRTGNQQKLSQEIQSKKHEISEVFTKRNQRRTQTRSQEIIVIEQSPEGKILKSLQPEEIGNIELSVPLVKKTKKQSKKDLIFLLLLITYISTFFVLRKLKI